MKFLRVCFQSSNVQEAYYLSSWYDFSEDYKKSLTICMIGSSRPLRTGGGFYTYSKISFTSVSNMTIFMGVVGMGIVGIVPYYERLFNS